MTAIDMRAVLPPGSWRDARAYASLAQVGLRGLAWELLRRDPAYADAVKTVSARRSDAREGILPAAESAFVARWGLHFRRIARTRRARCAAAVVARL